MTTTGKWWREYLKTHPCPHNMASRVWWRKGWRCVYCGLPVPESRLTDL